MSSYHCGHRKIRDKCSVCSIVGGKFNCLSMEELNSLTNVLYAFNETPPVGFGWMTYAIAKTLYEEMRKEALIRMKAWHDKYDQIPGADWD